MKLGSCLVRLDFPGTGGQGGQTSRFSAPPHHGCTYSYMRKFARPSRVCLRAHGCTFPVLRFLQTRWRAQFWSEMSDSPDDWEEAPAELEAPEGGWPWQFALCRVFDCQQVGYSRSFKIQCTKCGLPLGHTVPPEHLRPPRDSPARRSSGRPFRL